MGQSSIFTVPRAIVLKAALTTGATARKGKLANVVALSSEEVLALT